jgi:hypothetical protein
MMPTQSSSARVLCGIRAVLVFTALLLAGRAHAFYQGWVINEVYSNADGSIQFVELRALFSSQHVLANGATLIARDTNAASHVYVFTSDLPSSMTFAKTMLLATPDFATQPGAVTPDFIIPPNFLFFPAGSLQYPDAEGNEFMTYTNLPADGVASLVRSGGDELVYSATNSPRNFAGQTGSVRPSSVRLLSPLKVETQFVFSFNTSTGKTYTVEATDTLAPTNWQAILSIPGTGSANRVTNDSTLSLQRFYRLRAE